MSITLIPLKKLNVSAQNVRKTGGENIAELKASIASVGLLQNLQVVAAKKGKFEVVAGGRRLSALQELAAEGVIATDYEVPCQITNHDNVTEVSLAENAIREQMHPADQFEAFKRLADEGKDAADIAARFGVAESTVLKRLKLASASPVLFDLYRNGEMKLEQLMAFSISDDHEKQESVWNAVKDTYNDSAHAIRRALTETRVASNDPRVLCVGEEAYLAAGGSITRDLFSSEVYLDDPELVNRLLTDKLRDYAEGIKAEGWKWAQADLLRKEDFSLYGEIDSEEAVLIEQEEAEIARLEAEKEALGESYENGEIDENTADEQFNALETQIDAIREKPETFSVGNKARAGVIIQLDRAGQFQPVYGLVRPEDRTVAEIEARQHSVATSKKEKPRISAPLRESLTAHRTAALRASLLANPDEALTALLQTLVCEVFYATSRGKALTLKVHHASIDKSCETLAESPAMQQIFAEQEHWQALLPQSASDVWEWLDGIDAEQKQRLLAFCVSTMVDCTMFARGMFSVTTDALPLLPRLNIDMNEWWQPTAETYLSRVSIKLIAEAVGEVCGDLKAQYIQREKKRDAVTQAEQLLAGTGWLPPELRSDDYNADEVAEITANNEEETFAEEWEEEVSEAA